MVEEKETIEISDPMEWAILESFKIANSYAKSNNNYSKRVNIQC